MMRRPARKPGPLPAFGAALFFALAGCAGPTLRVHPRAAAWERPRRGEGETSGPPLRVLLKFGSRGLKASAPGGLKLEAPDGAALGEIPAQGKARLGALDGLLMMNGRALDESSALILPLRAGEAVRVGGRRYRGRLLVNAEGNQLALVNVVGLEDYLRGVLPSEVPSGGPAEALKAQAVAARSFALTQMLAASGRAWDLDNSADSQVYGSRDAETGATDAAVRDTQSEVLAFNGGVANTYFHSNSGGYTADASEVWSGQDSPAYLQGVSDPWSDHQAHYSWKASLPRWEAQALLQKAGLLHSALDDVVPHGRSESERWTKIDLITGDGNTVTVSANAFRRALGADRVRSTRFWVRFVGENLVFDGLGWGHGVGMAQEGAFAMARSGWDYRDILYFYYPGTYLARLHE
ncbi:MAG TPA: SpoIID/LytB domain-containing protein [bacterium]|jgi:stage II sporulation protein D|nr:SpoIID/LytB domain-containing protein [bacterium]